MESENRKLFVGGISWDTDEQRLGDYFSKYGEVVETVIMRDRATGRSRGFGFIVFRDPSDAERVIMEKHMIDGRTVEAKRAVLRDDQNMINRNFSSIQGSASPGHTKKIFVGGLPSSITESNFKKYFDQFGTITDVVVMYDHKTQRPRGFGFITYDSDDAVDEALCKTFHKLNGKMVEVKRAVPKERSPGSNRSSYLGHNDNNGLSRSISFLNDFGHGYNNISSVGGNGRSGFSAFGTAASGLGLNAEQCYGGRMLSHYYYENLPNRRIPPVGYSRGIIDSFSTSNDRDVWGSGVLNHAANPATPGSCLSSLGRNLGGSFQKNVGDWEPSEQDGGTITWYNSSRRLGCDRGDNGCSSGNSGYQRNSKVGNGGRTSTFSGSNWYESTIGELSGSGSFYTDSTWRLSAPELEGPSGVPF